MQTRLAACSAVCCGVCVCVLWQAAGICLLWLCSASEIREACCFLIAGNWISLLDRACCFRALKLVGPQSDSYCRWKTTCARCLEHAISHLKSPCRSRSTSHIRSARGRGFGLDDYSRSVAFRFGAQVRIQRGPCPKLPWRKLLIQSHGLQAKVLGGPNVGCRMFSILTCGLLGRRMTSQTRSRTFLIQYA